MYVCSSLQINKKMISELFQNYFFVNRIIIQVLDLLQSDSKTVG